MAQTISNPGAEDSSGIITRRRNIIDRNRQTVEKVIADFREEIADLAKRRDTRRAVGTEISNRAADDYDRQINELERRIRAIEALPLESEEIWDDDDIRATPPTLGGGGSSSGNGASGSWEPAPAPQPAAPAGATANGRDPVGAALGEAERKAKEAASAPGAPAAGITPGETPTAAAEGGGSPNPDGKFGIPGGAQVWEGPDGYWYVVYTVPGSQPPVPLAWRIENDQDVAAIFGAGNDWRTDRKLNAEEWRSAGVLSFGPSRQLANLSEHPFDRFVANFETEAKIRPWLRDEEVLAVTTRAILENREVTEAELAGTKWWQTHTEAERQWMGFVNTDPATARQKVQDSRDATRQLMVKLGISEPPEQLVSLIADRITGGTWTAAYAQSQIGKLADPAAPGQLDTTLATWVADLAAGGVTLDTLADNTSKVDALVKQWLGPVIASGWSKEQKEHWAGRLRNDPQAEQALIDELKRQRLGMLPEYENPDLSYEDIAAPWRSVVAQRWGQMMDETDPLFDRILRTNDRSAAEGILRQEGIKRGVGQVVDTALADMAAGFGNGVRRAL